MATQLTGAVQHPAPQPQQQSSPIRLATLQAKQGKHHKAKQPAKKIYSANTEAHGTFKESFADQLFAL